MKVILQVAFLQETVCGGEEQCGMDVADNYPDMMKHTAQNFIVAIATEQLCMSFCEATTAVFE